MVECFCNYILELTYAANGNLIAQYLYDDWGKLIAIDTADEDGKTAYREIAEANPLRYRGYYYDSEKDIKNRNNYIYEVLFKSYIKKCFRIVMVTNMNYIYYGFLSLILLPLLIIIWVIQILYKLIDQKVHFDKEGGIYVRLKFDYWLLFFVLIIMIFSMAIVGLKENVLFSLIIIGLLLILLVGIILHFVSNGTLKKISKQFNNLNSKKTKIISSIIISVDLVLLEFASYVFWQISLH